MSWPPPVELVGRHARLAPLEVAHAPALAGAVMDGELWKLWFTFVAAPEDMEADVERRLATPYSTPFAVIELATGEHVRSDGLPQRGFNQPAA